MSAQTREREQSACPHLRNHVAASLVTREAADASCELSAATDRLLASMKDGTVTDADYDAYDALANRLRPLLGTDSGSESWLCAQHHDGVTA